MAAKDLHLDDDVNVMENIYVREDNNDGDVNATCTVEAKAKRDKKQQRKRSTSRGGGGGGGLLKNFRRRGSVGSNVHFDPEEFSAEIDRKLVSKSSAQLTMNSLTKSRFLFLYEGVLIIAKQKWPASFHLKIRVDLRDVWLTDDYQDPVDADSCVSSKATAYRLGWPMATVDLEFLTAEEKNAWVEKLQTMVTIVRENEDPSVIIRLAKNDEQFSVTKKCLVRKTESARNVLARCAQLFHSKSDSRPIEDGFQLQAMTNANEDPIPLTGSEILYRIQTKYNREHGDGRKDRTAAEDHNAESAGDELVFQVTSLEKKAAADDHHNKAANGVTSLARFFRAPHESLFRRSLAELYRDGKLCLRLMKVLSYLYVNGPSADQVFRRPPSQKEQIVLQEKFERGKEINYDKVTACEMSQLLKTFLKCLPECLLTNELYDEWFEIPKQNDRTAMISLARSLVGRLPECNLVLLRHLMCVLRRISSESVVNGMAPRSLSICIGQCLLWLPVNTAAPDEMQNVCHRIEVVNRVTEVLIDNAPDIFGDECFHLFDHLNQQPPSATNEISEASDVIGSMETENATDMKSEPVLATSSFDQDVTMNTNSLSSFDHSANGANDEMGLLHEVTQAVAMRLNGPSLLLLLRPGTLQDPASIPPASVCAETATDPDSPHRSSQLDPFPPEKQSITDDNNNEEEEQEEEEEEKKEKGVKDERSVQMENSIESCTSSNQLPAAEEEEEDVFHPDAFPTRKHSPPRDGLSTPAISAAERCAPSGEISFASVDNKQYSDVKSRSSAAESIGLLPSFPSGPPQATSVSVFPVGRLDASSPIPILVLPGTPETSDAPVEAASETPEQSKKAKEVTSYEPTQSSAAAAAAAASATAESMKSHLQMLVVPSLKSLSVESSPVTCKAKDRPEMTSTVEGRTKFPGRRILSSPDDGYSTSSIKTPRGSGPRREHELVPSRIDKRFSPYSENASPSKLAQRSPFQTGRGGANSAYSDSGLRDETPAAARSPPYESITPPGIVRRLKTQIEKREKPPGPFSPTFKGTSGGSLAVSPSFRAVHSDVGAAPPSASSNEHSAFQQHSSRRSSWRRELPSDLQKIDAIKIRFAAPVSPSENLHKPAVSIGTCSRVGSTEANINLLTAANKEGTTPNAEGTEKPANEPIIPSPRPKDPVANANRTITEPEDSPKDAKERASNRDGGGRSQKTPREDDQLLRHSDPKVTPRQARERRRSDCGGAADLRARNKENRENVARCCQLQKRPSPTTELVSSTHGKVSRISTEAEDKIGKLQEEVSPATMPSETNSMSVRHRDWHRRLTEQYSNAASGDATVAAAAAVTTGCSTSQRPQRSVAQLGCKMSYTPVPLRVFHHGTERNRATATSAAAAKK